MVTHARQVLASERRHHSSLLRSALDRLRLQTMDRSVQRPVATPPLLAGGSHRRVRQGRTRRVVHRVQQALDDQLHGSRIQRQVAKADAAVQRPGIPAYPTACGAQSVVRQDGSRDRSVSSCAPQFACSPREPTIEGGFRRVTNREPLEPPNVVYGTARDLEFLCEGTGALVLTDPSYLDNIPYPELAGFLPPVTGTPQGRRRSASPQPDFDG